MVQEFFIRRGSTLPTLRMEVINDGRHDFNKIQNALLDADVTFSMWDSETETPKIVDAPCEVVRVMDGSCEEKYAIQYSWKERDTRCPGIFTGEFNIHFRGELTEDGVSYPKEGDLIVPIASELKIYIR